MRPRTLLVMFIACAAVVALAYQVHRRTATEWSATEQRIDQPLFPRLPVNDVRKVTIKSADHEVELVRDKDIWTVANGYHYPADFDQLTQFLRLVATLKPVLAVPVLPADLPRLQLAEPGPGTVVQLAGDQGQVLARFILGKPYEAPAKASDQPWAAGPSGRYLLLTATGNVVVIKENLPGLDADAKGWLDKAFLHVDKVKTATLQHGAEVVWSASREQLADVLKPKLTLAPGEDFNPDKARALADALSWVTFDAVADPATPPGQLGFAEGQRYTVETFDGFTYALDIGQRQPNGSYPLKINVAYHAATTPAPPNETPEAAGIREKKDQDDAATGRTRFEFESQRFAAWVYLIPEFTIKRFLLTRDDWVMKQPAVTPGPKVEETDATHTDLNTLGTAPNQPAPPVKDPAPEKAPPAP